MPYRDAVGPEEETLETFDVSAAKGANTIGILVAFVVLFVVAYVVSLVSGAPPELEPWVWTFPVAAGVFAAPALWLRQRRKRKLLVVRVGEKVKLVVRGEVELTFPLTGSGSQMVMHTRGVPSYHVFMKLVDGEGRGIYFSEIRGAVHGAQPNWFESIDRTTPAQGYELGRAGDAARIRFRVEEINGKEPADVT